MDIKAASILDTSRADFALRVYVVKQYLEENKVHPEVMRLVNDLHDAFERGFEVAIILKNKGNKNALGPVGEYLRLYLMNEREEASNYLKSLKKDM